MPTPPYTHLKDISCYGRSVLVRADFNVPLEEGAVADPTRLIRALKTLRFLKQQQAQPIVLSHLGRPKGKPCLEFSLKPVAKALQTLAPDLNLVFCPFFRGEEALSFLKASGIGKGQTVLLENLRFDPGEALNEAGFVQELSRLGEIYVNDAFSVSHRAHGSIVGLPHYLPAVAGFLLDEEARTLLEFLETPRHPLMAIVGGAKLSTKLALLKNLLSKVDVLAIGGAMAHTFLKAQGLPIGASLREDLFLETAKEIIQMAQEKQKRLLLPIDGVAAEVLKPHTKTRTLTLAPTEKYPLQENESLFDVGPQTIKMWASLLKTCQTVVWNGPLGAFEVPPFHESTHRLAQIIATFTDNQRVQSIVGGGDTLAALQQEEDLLRHFTYASPAGGAFLAWLEGKTLPGLKALADAAYPVAQDSAGLL